MAKRTGKAPMPATQVPTAEGVVTARTPARVKRSVTLDPAIVEAVDAHVARGAATSFSAAINDAGARWVANADLRASLDEFYADNPDARPTAAEVAAAAAELGLR